MVLDTLERELAPGDWAIERPKGGYFCLVLCAEVFGPNRALELCKEAGVVMTAAGYLSLRRGPQDSNIRIAPSLPPVEELEQAMTIFCLCIRQAALEKRIREA